MCRFVSFGDSNMWKCEFPMPRDLQRNEPKASMFKFPGMRELNCPARPGRLGKPGKTQKNEENSKNPEKTPEDQENSSELEQTQHELEKARENSSSPAREN